MRASKGEDEFKEGEVLTSITHGTCMIMRAHIPHPKHTHPHIPTHTPTQPLNNNHHHNNHQQQQQQQQQSNTFQMPGQRCNPAFFMRGRDGKPWGRDECAAGRKGSEGGRGGRYPYIVGVQK